MAGRSSRYNLSDVLELLDGYSLDDFGLAESEDSDCEDGEVGSYLPEVQLGVDEPYHSIEDTLEMDSDPGHGESTNIVLVVLVDSEKLGERGFSLSSTLVEIDDLPLRLYLLCR